MLCLLDEAKAFVALMEGHFQDRRNLDHIKIGNIAKATKNSMIHQMQRIELMLEQANLIFIFPA